MEDNTGLLIMKESDNVAIAIRQIEAGETVSDAKQNITVVAAEKIPFGFKMAIKDIAMGGLIYKYGEPIGKSVAAISPGQLVHVHNIEGVRARGDL